MSELPDWSKELIELYLSNSTSQFILHGNVNDRFILPLKSGGKLAGLVDFVEEMLLPGFDVVLSYDLGNGVRVEKGGDIFSQWPTFKENSYMPRKPRESMEFLTHYVRYCANLNMLKKSRTQVGIIIKAAHLVIPDARGSISHDLSAMALLMRDWSVDTLLNHVDVATFLVAENLNDLHPIVVNNPRASQIQIALPSAAELGDAFRLLAPKFPLAFAEYADDLDRPASQLTGTTLAAVESLLKTKEYRKEAIKEGDLSELKKSLVERDCNGLIEFIEPTRTLDDVYGQEEVKEWIRQDVELWRQNDISAMPMGYLLCGPVGTGKTYMVECLAGEAGVPVVKFKNFRDRWVGSTEGNLEKIFALLHALGRCVVFIDEADQALGKRDSGSGDSGVSGRVYSMMAKEMSDSSNRGKILWILASSRPDLIEVDLKRPGRVDVKIPLFPSTTPEEGFFLIRALCKKQKVDLPKESFEELKLMIPKLVTPGAAESLSIKVYRMMKTKGMTPVEALRDCLTDYQSPVAEEIIEAQIRLAVNEASDLRFVPEMFRK
jgi:hypothetical protein